MCQQFHQTEKVQSSTPLVQSVLYCCGFTILRSTTNQNKCSLSLTQLNTPRKSIIMVNDAMSGWLKYGHNVGFWDVFLQDVSEQSWSDGNNAHCQSAAWIAM